MLTVVVTAARWCDPFLGFLELKLPFLLVQLFDVLWMQHPLLPAHTGSCSELQRRQPRYQKKQLHRRPAHDVQTDVGVTDSLGLGAEFLEAWYCYLSERSLPPS